MRSETLEQVRAALRSAEGHLSETRKDERWHPVGHCPVLDVVRSALSALEADTQGEKPAPAERGECCKALELALDMIATGSIVAAAVEDCRAALASCRCGEQQPLHQRVWDLLRQQRMELHAANLISNEEYAQLAADHPAVARLENYDAVRADRDQLRRELQHLRDRLDDRRRATEKLLGIVIPPPPTEPITESHLCLEQAHHDLTIENARLTRELQVARDEIKQHDLWRAEAQRQITALRKVYKCADDVVEGQRYSGSIDWNEVANLSLAIEDVPELDSLSSSEGAASENK